MLRIVFLMCLFVCVGCTTDTDAPEAYSVLGDKVAGPGCPGKCHNSGTESSVGSHTDVDANINSTALPAQCVCEGTHKWCVIYNDELLYHWVDYGESAFCICRERGLCSGL